MEEGVSWTAFWAQHAEAMPAEPSVPTLRARIKPEPSNYIEPNFEDPDYHEPDDEEPDSDDRPAKRSRGSPDVWVPRTRHSPKPSKPAKQTVKAIKHQPIQQSPIQQPPIQQQHYQHQLSDAVQMSMAEDARLMHQMQVMEMHRASQQQLLQQPMMQPINQYQPWHSHFNSPAPYYYYNQFAGHYHIQLPMHQQMDMARHSTTPGNTASPSSPMHSDRVPSKFGEGLHGTPSSGIVSVEARRFVPPSGAVDAIITHYMMLSQEMSMQSETGFMSRFMEKKLATEQAIWDLGLSLRELNYVLTDYYPNSVIAVRGNRPIPPEFLFEKKNGKTVSCWLSHTMVAAAVLATCFQPLTGKLWNSDKLLVPTDALSKLVEYLMDWILLVEIAMARSKDCLVPIEVFVESCLSNQVVSLFWTRSVHALALTISLWLEMYIYNKWQLFDLDTCDPRLGTRDCPNAYLENLWNLQQDGPFWRQLIRRGIYVAGTREIMFAIDWDVHPRISSQQVMMLKPTLPDSVYSFGWNKWKAENREMRVWDDWITMVVDGKKVPMNSMSWILHARGDTVREAGLTAVVDGLLQGRSSLFHLVTVIGLAVCETCYAEPPKPYMDSFYPSLEWSVKVNVPGADPMVQSNPRMFWIGVIEDLFHHLPESIRDPFLAGESAKFWQGMVSRDCLQPQDASNVLSVLLRLVHYKLQLLTTAPLGGLETGTVGFQFMLKWILRWVTGETSVEGASPQALRQLWAEYQTHHAGLNLDRQTKWLHVFPDIALEEILGMCVATANIIKDLAVIQPIKAMPGPATITLCLKLILLHMGIASRLAGQQHTEPMRKLLEASLADARGLIRLMAELHVEDTTRDFSPATLEQPFEQWAPQWIQAISRLLESLEEPTVEYVREIWTFKNQAAGVFDG